MKNYKILLFLVPILILYGCTKEAVSPSVNTNQDIQITTSGLDFVPSTLNCKIGDTVYFNLGPSHNAVEVSQEDYNTSNGNSITNGFNIDFGESTFIVFTVAKTHFYVCQPHLPGMKGIIVVE